MSDDRRSRPQAWLTILAVVSALALLTGVAHRLLTGSSSSLLVVAAITLMVSLTLLASLRRRKGQRNRTSTADPAQSTGLVADDPAEPQF